MTPRGSRQHYKNALCLLRWLDTVKKKMRRKPFDTPILYIFNLYSRNNDEYG